MQSNYIVHYQANRDAKKYHAGCSEILRITKNHFNIFIIKINIIIKTCIHIWDYDITQPKSSNMSNMRICSHRNDLNTRELPVLKENVLQNTVIEGSSIFCRKFVEISSRVCAAFKLMEPHWPVLIDYLIHCKDNVQFIRLCFFKRADGNTRAKIILIFNIQ